MKLLFVCTGNICRSPFAEAFARHLVADRGLDVDVDSAGIYAVVGAPAPTDGIEAARRWGIDMRPHRGRQLVEEDLAGDTRIFVMSPRHRAEIGDLYHTQPRYLRILSDFAPGPVRPPLIADPYLCEPWAYVTCYSLIADCVTRVIEELAFPGAPRQP